MNVIFACPQCERSTRAEFSPESDSITCEHCRLILDIPEDTFVDGRLRHCLACPSADLFLRKDFPPRLGVTITVVGFLFASIAWYQHHALATYTILFATALGDFVLYLVLGDALSCYRCGAHYRGVDDLQQYGTFRLETHERYRQQAARMAQASAPADHDDSDG